MLTPDQNVENSLFQSLQRRTWPSLYLQFSTFSLAFDYPRANLVPILPALTEWPSPEKSASSLFSSWLFFPRSDPTAWLNVPCYMGGFSLKTKICLWNAWWICRIILVFDRLTLYLSYLKDQKENKGLQHKFFKVLWDTIGLYGWDSHKCSSFHPPQGPCSKYNTIPYFLSS